MPQSGSADHLLFDRLLTNVIYEKGMGAEGVASALAPRVRSTSITGQFMRRERGNKEAGVDTERAPGAEVQTGERPGKTLETFRTVDHALKELIPQEITSGMDETELLGEQQSTAEDVLRKINHNWEKDVHSSVWASDESGFNSIYGSSSVDSPSTKWDADPSSNNPTLKKDVLNLKTKIYRACGYMPNKMLMPNQVFNAITTMDNELRDVTKYVGETVTAAKLASYFEVDELLVPMYLDDHTSGNNEDNSMDFLWTGDHVGLFYVDDSNTRNKDTLMSTFFWDNPDQRFFSVFTGFNKARKSEEVEVGGYFTTEEIDMDCGGVLANVLT